MMSEVMSDLNEEIRKLKEEGLSLRGIASALGISHEAVRKRLKVVKDKDQVSTTAEDRKLTASTIKKEKVSTGSKPCKSRASEELGDTVNLKQTSTDTGEGVNPSGNHSRGPLWGMKGVYQGVDSESGDLFKGIKDFLEANGIEVYRINVEPEGYQVKHNGQVIRFYVERGSMECPKSPGTG
jgi:predicted transcriptional regulator